MPGSAPVEEEGAKVDYRVAPPAEMGTPTRSERKSLKKECGWKDGVRGGPAQGQEPTGRKKKTDLTRISLLREGIRQFRRGGCYTLRGYPVAKARLSLC